MAAAAKAKPVTLSAPTTSPSAVAGPNDARSDDLPRFDFEVLQHAAALAVRRVRRETLPALIALLMEAAAAEAQAGAHRRWPPARKLILVTRLSALSGCIEQLAVLERLLAGQHAAGPNARGVTRILPQLRAAQDDCRDVEERAMTLLVHVP